MKNDSVWGDIAVLYFLLIINGNDFLGGNPNQLNGGKNLRKIEIYLIKTFFFKWDSDKRINFIYEYHCIKFGQSVADRDTSARNLLYVTFIAREKLGNHFKNKHARKRRCKEKRDYTFDRMMRERRLINFCLFFVCLS